MMNTGAKCCATAIHLNRTSFSLTMPHTCSVKAVNGNPEHSAKDWVDETSRSAIGLLEENLFGKRRRALTNSLMM